MSYLRTIITAAVSIITLSTAMSHAAISPDARNARNEKAVNFTMAVENVDISPKDPQADGDGNCRVSGKVLVVKNDGSENSRMVFAPKSQDALTVELGCHSASYNTAPGAFRVSSDELKKAKAVEFWGQMILKSKDGSFIDASDAVRMTPEAWAKYTAERTSVFVPFDIKIEQ